MENKEQQFIMDKGTGFDPTIPDHDEIYIAGSNSKVVHEEVLQSMDWFPYAQKDETQKPPNAEDRMNCTAQGGVESGGMQVNLRISRNELDLEKLAPWLDKNGKFNGSERHISIVSHNTPQGNSMQNVLEAIRKKGIIPESMLSDPGNISWEGYHNENVITSAMDQMGLKFLEYFDVSYERLPQKWLMGWGSVSFALMKHHLKQAPLYCAAGTCPGWFGSLIIKACGMTPNHVFVVPKFDGNKPMVKDSYPPYNRKLAANYKIPYVYKMVITPKPAILKPKTKFMNTNVQTMLFIGKDGIKRAGHFVPSNSPSAYRSNSRNYGLYVAGQAPDQVDWEKEKFDITHNE